MKKRNWNHALFVVATTLSLTLFFVGTQPASAAYQYSASVSGQVGADTFYEAGTMSASKTVSAYGAQAAASAGFYGSSPVVSATSTGTANYARASAGVGDWLMFSGPSGSYADVTIHIAGNWSIFNDFSTPAPWESPRVRFDVDFTQAGSPTSNDFYSTRYLRGGSTGGSIQGSGTWVDFSDGLGSTASGTYSFDLVTRVYYGFNYHFGLAVTAEAPYLHSAYIDDPVTINLPDGVTFTSLSNSQYGGASVPLPPSILLLAPGLIGLAVARRRFTK